MRVRQNNVVIATIIVLLFTLIYTTMVTSGQVDLAATGTPKGPTAQTNVYIPMVNKSIPVVTSGDWTQYAHDAEHTGYTSQEVATPWRWKWSWNGPNAQGGVSSGKFAIPRNVQPITGGGRVYIAAGTRGVYALNENNGSQAWNANPGGEIDSTPAYDPQSGALLVVSSNGHLYKLNAATGQTIGDYNGQSTSTLPLPPVIYGNVVYFSMGNDVFAIDISSMGQVWAYDAGSPVQTPPAISPNKGLVIALSQDLYVHAIHTSNGTQAWRVKPTSLSPGNPGDSSPYAEVTYGWPVVAEVHGLVFVRYRLNWQTLWTWSPWPSTNAQMRSNLQSRPDQQSLFALNLSNGSTAFISNVGNGGFGDGGRLNMGPQPVVKEYPNGTEIAYVVMRGANCINTPCDGRYDSHFGELMLDSTTVQGYQAGEVRFMQNTFFPTDEQVSLTMSANDILGGHWMFGIAQQIQDRSASKGSSSSNPITLNNLPHIVTSASNCGFSASHYCPNGLLQDGDPRSLPAGFYIYYNQGTVYDQYWRSSSTWIVSGSMVYFLSNDGALVALENGNPSADSLSSITVPPSPTATPVLPNPIPYQDARQYAGSVATVYGQIQFAFNNGKELLLGFQNPHMGAFKAMIEVQDFGAFTKSPDELYQVGDTVQVTGKIEWFEGDPVIYVRDPSQITVTGNQAK